MKLCASVNEDLRELTERITMESNQEDQQGRKDTHAAPASPERSETGFSSKGDPTLAGNVELEQESASNQLESFAEMQRMEDGHFEQLTREAEVFTLEEAPFKEVQTRKKRAAKAAPGRSDP
jgi:hypothetical protein